MGLLESVKSAFKKGGDRVKETVTGSKHVATIWDLEDVPSFREFWQNGIFPWKYIYRGYYSAWHNISDPTIQDANHKRDIYRLNAGKFVCQTITRYVWGEQCAVNVSQTGKEKGEDDPLNLFIGDVLTINNFYNKLSDLYEQGAALGGGCVKTWGEVKAGKQAVNEAGEIIPSETEKNIRLSYHMADQFIPTDWTNADITGGIFISREAKKGYYYTRVERHKLTDETYSITNQVYRERAEDVERVKTTQGVEPQTILGWEYPLNEIYPQLAPYAEIENLEQSLFSYIKPSGTNNLDDNSPLGISIYANALDTLHALDIAYDEFVNEIILSRKRIIVPSRSLTPTADESGVMRRYFNPRDSIYEALNFDNVNDLKVEEMESTLRVDDYVSAINALLSLLCVQLGLDAGAIAFDKATGLKTATEVISENSKTYSTVRSHQNLLKAAIEKLIHNIIDVAVLYGVEYDGVSVASLTAGGYEVAVHFDDSIIQDRQTDIAEGVLLNGAGLLSKKRFMTETLGYTDEQAAEELAQIASESTVQIEDVDEFNNKPGE
ncbi:MAG: phage portal protein [Eubacteriales bacterium]